MPSEPNWSKDVSNSTVCTWFYILALMNGLAAVAGILVFVFMSKKMSAGLSVPMLLGAVGAFVNAWFLFLVCNRGLHEGFKVKR